MHVASFKLERPQFYSAPPSHPPSLPPPSPHPPSPPTPQPPHTSPHPLSSLFPPPAPHTHTPSHPLPLPPLPIYTPHPHTSTRTPHSPFLGQGSCAKVRFFVNPSNKSYCNLELCFLPHPIAERGFPHEQCILHSFEWTYIGTNRPTSSHPKAPQRFFHQPSGTSLRNLNWRGANDNKFESFHHHQQLCLHDAQHPGVRQFLRDVHQQVALADLRIAPVNAGHTRVPKRNSVSEDREVHDCSPCFERTSCTWWDS